MYSDAPSWLSVNASILTESIVNFLTRHPDNTHLEQNSRWLLKKLIPVQLIFLAYLVFYFYSYGHLPSPFFIDSSDSFMDFFNTNYWALRDGRFDEWKSIYPIFVFLLSRLTISTSCLESSSSFALRSCDTYSLIYLLLPYLYGSFICAKLLTAATPGTASHSARFLSQKNRERITTLLWFIAVAFSLQGLFALERGNYIVIAFLFLALSAINIKQYLLVLWVVQLIKNRFDLVLLGLIFAIMINLVGMIFIPESHYDMLIDNMLGFSSGLQISFFEKLWNPTSTSAWQRVFENSPKLELILQYDWIALGKIATTALVFISRILIAFCCTLLFLRARRLDSNYISFALLLCLLVLSDSLGGYALLLLFAFLPGILNRPLSRASCLLILLIFMPIEFAIGPGLIETKPAFLSGIISSEVMRVSLGSLMRPLVLIGVLTMIISDLYAISANDKSAQKIPGQAHTPAPASESPAH